MSVRHGLVDGGEAVRPITPLTPGDLPQWLTAQRQAVVTWVRSTGFTAERYSVCLIPTADGSIERVLYGCSDEPGPWPWAALPGKLPAGTYCIDGALTRSSADAAALGWSLAAYRFDRYRTDDTPVPHLVWPDTSDRAAVLRAADATTVVRDLINTPASDLGPEDLASVIEKVGHSHGAAVSTLRGDELLQHNYPLIHAVGRASSRRPCLIDLTWGDPASPRVTLVGKGVCFDSGGLDLKPAPAMKLMKKDMGGAAILLGLAQMLMQARAPLRLRLLVPAVENSVGGRAFRPLDVITSRSGRSVEIGNTDAEGRLILADALSEAARELPSMIVDCATLTGAARVALGSELPAMFCNDDVMSEALLAAGRSCGDPLWRLPLWKPYRRHLESKIADANNAPEHPFAGAITAALFLEDFVQPVCPWIHIDVMAWNLDSRPGRPEGGEAMTMRALYALISGCFAAVNGHFAPE